MKCKMLCLIKGQSGFVSLAEYPISTAVPLDLSSASSCICQHCIFARYSIIEYSASSHDFTRDNSVVACWGFPINLFLERKYIEYWILIWNLLLLMQGLSGLVSLVAYPLSTVSVIHVSSESTCTCLCGMKARDGICCLFNDIYHVLLRLPVGLLFKVGFQSIIEQRCFPS